MKFYQELDVRYKDNYGKINFICHEYVTMTLKDTNTNLLIYHNDWNEVYPMTGNRKEEQ